MAETAGHQPADGPMGGPKGSQRGIAGIIVALCLAEATVTFESTMIYAALPTLIRTFGDPIKAGWLVTAHMLIAAATAPLAGRLGDIYGRRRLILILLFLALVGSVISAATTHFGLVVLGRALQGLSSAVLPLSIGVVRQALPEGRTPMAIGLLTSALGAGAATGLVLGGIIVDNLNWHWLFVASAVLLALSLAACLAWVPGLPGTPTRHPIDWAEGLLPVPGIAAILYAIGESKQAGWLSPMVLGLIALGIGLMALWARRSLRSPEPFIDLRLFLNRNFAVANAISVLLAMGTMQIVYVFSAYVQSPGWTAVGLGLSATVAGFAKLPSNITSLFAGPFSAMVTRRLGHRATIMTGAGVGAAGWLFALTLPEQLVTIIVLLCVISFGTTMLQAGIPNVIVDCAPASRTSEAVGTMSVTRGIATALGAQVIALLLASSTIASPDGGAAFPSQEGYLMTMGWIAALTIGAALLGLLLRGKAR